MGGRTRRTVETVLTAVLVLAAASAPRAAVLMAQDEALALVFPEAQVETRTVVLRDDQVAAVEVESGVRMESKLFRYFVARRAGELLGYAVIDTHVVRTMSEALLVVLSPAGAIRRVLLLAFHEPPEYEPTTRWLEQFTGRDASTRRWRVGREVHGLTGATLTAHAVADALRKIVALHATVIHRTQEP